MAVTKNRARTHDAQPQGNPTPRRRKEALASNTSAAPAEIRCGSAFHKVSEVVAAAYSCVAAAEKAYVVRPTVGAPTPTTMNVPDTAPPTSEAPSPTTSR